MEIQICGAPCCWGVDDPKNPYLPPWTRVLSEAGQAGYRAIELGPYGYLPLDLETVTNEMNKNGLAMVAGTIFEDLVDINHRPYLMEETDNICSLITKLPQLPTLDKQKFPAPFLVVIDWGHDERDYTAGHPDRAPRLSQEDWDTMMETIRMIAERAKKYGVRTVVHPHAGGYIEFEDEIRKVVEDIPYETAGLCLDTGHLYYSKMDPVSFLREFADRTDYVHFKDIDKEVYERCSACTSASLRDAASVRCARSDAVVWIIRRSAIVWKKSATADTLPSSRSAIRAMSMAVSRMSRAVWTTSRAWDI